MTLLGPQFIAPNTEPVPTYTVRMSFVNCDGGEHCHMDLQSKPILLSDVQQYVEDQIAENGDFMLNAYIVLKHVDQNPWSQLFGSGNEHQQQSGNTYNPGGYH